MDVLAASLRVINLRSVPGVERSVFSPALNFKTAAENPDLAKSGLRIATRVSRSLAKRKAKKNMAAARSALRMRN